MTVSTTVNKIVQLGDGVTTVFSFPFAVRSGGQTDIQVFITVSGVLTQLTFGTQYTVSLNAAIAPNPTPVGGTVTLSVAPANGALVTVLRTMALTQPTSLANQGTLYQPVLESTDDNQELQLQQVSELQGRAIVVAVSDNAPTALPPAAQRANLAMGFDASGNPIAFSTAPAGTISSAMAPFVASASIAAAKALLGYGTMANENIGAAGKGIIDDGSGNARVNQTITAVAGNQSPGVQQHMINYASSGTNTFTLPKLTTVFNGYELWVFCLTNTATLSPNASDNFPGAGGGVSVVLVQGQCARLIGDGISAWQIFLGRIPGIGSLQTAQKLTSGSSATYTTPVGCRRILVREVGGGGGGAGTAGSNGGNGTQTSFAGNTANGGSGGTAAGNGGAGGTGGSTAVGTEILRVVGGAGQSGLQNGAGTGITTSMIGGGTPFASGSTSSANSGQGGRADGTVSGGAIIGGAGGAGEYVEFVISNPAATYIYTVGTGGAGGGGSSQAGSAGIISVQEFY